MEVENLTQNSDGTFTGTVHYTATDADCEHGKVVLTVNATSTYEGAYTISSGDLASTATVTKTATTACKIAPESAVQYEFVSGTSGMTLPGAINTYLPVDKKTYQAKKTVKAKNPTTTSYEDKTNDGYWTFSGWDKDSVTTKVDGETVTFTGTWIFTKYSKYTIKYVDENGAELLDSTTVSGNKVNDKIKVSDIEKPTIAGYSFSKISPTSELKINSDDSKNVITLTYKKKAGKAGYYLVLGDATWSAPSDTTKESDAQKWYYNYGFAKNDTFVVTSSVPSADNHVFIGWMDKERDDQPAAIRKAGDTVTYCYSNNQTYTLDALWSPTAPTYTDAGEYPVKVKQDVTVGGATTTLTAETTIKIAKRSVTLESADLSKDYDGSALTNGNTALKTETGWVEGQGATYSFTGSQTDVGESANAFSYTLKEGTKADNYNITKSEGKLIVNDRSEKYAISVEGNSTTVVYDGNQHTASGITTASSTFINDKGVTFTIAADTTNPAATNVTSADNKVSNVKVTLNGKDVTKQFTVTTKDGKLTINPKAATITAGSAEKEYDGKALTTNEFATEGFVSGEGIASATIEGSQTVVGSTPSTVKAGSWTAKDGTNLNNYNITTANGALTVTDRAAKYQIMLEGITGTKTYNGSDQTMSGVITDEFEIDGVKFKVKNYKSDITGKDAGEYTQTITSTNDDGHWTVEDASGNDVSAQFSVSTTPGKLTIAPKDVTVTSGSASKTYDGAPLTKAEASVTAGGFIAGEEAGVSYTYAGSQTNQGSSKNKFDIVFDGTKAKAGNYNVTKVEGDLTVNAVTEKVTVTITEHGGSYTYDGTEKTATGYDVSSSNELYTANDFIFSGSDSVRGTNAGTYEMQLKASDFTNNSPNFTNVEFVVVDATLTIAKREVTLKSETATKVYDGTALTAKTVAIARGSFAEGQGFKAEATGSVTNVSEGEVDNAFDYELTGGATEGENGNYIITKQVGKLSITPVTSEVIVTITGHKTEAKYDGTEKTATGYDVSISNDLYKEGDFSYSGTSEVKATNTDTYEMGLTKGTFTNNNANFTNVMFNVTDGELSISKREVVLTSASDEKEYDGTALTRNEQTDVVVSGDGFADGEGATYTITGSQTVVGNSENEFSYTLNDNTLADNYTITTHNGTLNVTNRDAKYEVTVKANSATVTYDGKSHEAKGVETYEFTENGQKYTVSGLATEDPKQTDAGTYTNNITGTAKVTDAKGNDVTEQFTVKTENGKLVIDKAEVTLKSASDIWVYDGKAHNKNAMETVSGFAKGEGASFTYGKSVTNVSEGKVENTFSYALNDNTKEANYTFKTENGTLEVTPVTDKVTVAITGNTKTETFDGAQKSVEGYGFEASNSLYTESCVKFSGKAVASGTDVNKYDMGLSKSNFENNSSNFSNVEFAVTRVYFSSSYFALGKFYCKLNNFFKSC